MTIDWWTLALEAINVAVLVWLLGHFFWKPVATMLDERRAVATRDLDAAKAKRVEADKALADIAATRAGLQKEREKILAEAAAEADKERAARHEQASKEIEKLHDDAAAAIVKERKESAKILRDHAASLSVDIATRLLQRLGGAVTSVAFLSGLTDQIEKIPVAQRHALLNEPLKLISASKLSTDEQVQCRRALFEALGAQPGLSFECDPKLVAGLALQGANIVAGNNWRDDLERILSELKHD